MKDKGLYSGLAVADYFIEKAVADGKLISNMSVLKMIFFAQGFAYKHLDRRLISDSFYAWELGPVEKMTYHEFKRYGGQRIKKASGKTTMDQVEIAGDTEIKNFLDFIYNNLIKIDPFTLSDITHKKGSPWDETNPNCVINESVIKGYFVSNKI